MPSPSRRRGITRGEDGRKCPLQSDASARSAIRVIHQESRETYGSPSIWGALVKQGHRVGEHRVARLMRQDGIRAKTVKKWRATTQSQHRFPVAANTLRASSRSRPQSGVGRRHHLRLDPGGLAVSGGAAGSVLAPVSRLGDGPALDRGAGRAGARMAVANRSPTPDSCTTRIAAANMPHELPARAHHARHHPPA